MVVEMALVLGGTLFRLPRHCRASSMPAGYSNTKELGRLLYTDYVYPFELASVILLVAIIAAVMLTLRKRKDTKTMDPSEQISGQAQGPDAPGQDDVGKGRAGSAGNEGGNNMLQLSLSHYLILAAILFAISIVGIFLNRKNLIVLLMAIELMLLAVNTNFVAFSHYLNDLAGQLFVFFILTVAAAESAIGLAILVVLFRNLSTIHVDDLDSLKG